MMRSVEGRIKNSTTFLVEARLPRLPKRVKLEFLQCNQSRQQEHLLQLHQVELELDLASVAEHQRLLVEALEEGLLK